MAKDCGCKGSTCGCLVVGGDGITVEGIGTATNPFVVTRDGSTDSILGHLVTENTETVDLTLTGAGTLGDPLVLKAEAGSGSAGEPGPAGLSAYEIALSEGFVGDEASWLASLVGPAGAPGSDGDDGADGASAYEVAVADGFVGDETAWLASLVGPAGAPGDPGDPGATGPGVVVGGTTGQVLAKASGADFDTEWIDLPSGGSVLSTDITDSTAVGRSVLTAASSAAARTAVGLDNVDNTSDASKPISAATQAALDTKASALVALNAVTANYTLVLTDGGKAVEMSNASARTVTVPPNSAVAFPVGTVVEIARMGAGTVTVVAGSGVTIRTSGTLALRAQYSVCTIRKRATDEWVLAGDTA